MKITFISGFFCKERHKLLSDLALELGANGAEVTVLTGYPSRGISEEVRQYYLNHPVERISPHVVVKRIGCRSGEGEGLFIRMIKYCFLTLALYKEAKKVDTDVYYLYSTPPFIGYIGCKLAKHKPTLYNAQDLFPDTLARIKHMSNSNPLIRFFHHMERQVYQKNTHIVTISEDMKKTIVGAGAKENNVSVIYNWADTDHLRHVGRNDNHLLDELGIDKTKFIVSYAGLIGFFQGLDILLDVAGILKIDYPEILFVLIGDGQYKHKMLERVKNEGLTNVKIYPFQSANRLSEIYSIGDVELVSLEKGITRMSLPSKISVIMSVGSPILALVDKESEIYRIINQNKCGVAIEHGSKEKLADAILALYYKKEELTVYGQNAQVYAHANYSKREQTRKYYEQISDLTSRYIGSL